MAGPLERVLSARLRSAPGLDKSCGHEIDGKEDQGRGDKDVDDLAQMNDRA